MSRTRLHAASDNSPTQSERDDIAAQWRHDDDKPHEECGVFGVWNINDASALTALGLHALQHRGQEASGIVSYDGTRFHTHKGLGLVGDVFGDSRVMATLPG
ncbi:amidophosphoribosyltransferase, partial [Novacetimonas hansenii]|nr:amidophosphoribosyltransferase [Novacetimonas hansenii]